MQAKLVNLFIRDPLLANQIYLMQTVDPTAVDWNQLMDTPVTVGDYMRYPVVLVLIVLAIILYQSNIILKFRKTHNMKTLRAQEQYNWPAIMPVIKEDLVSKISVKDLGQWH